LIAQLLNNENDLIPSDIREKAQLRFDTAARKDPSLDPEKSREMSSLLAHCDIRDLQDTVTNKALWSIFADQFSSKPDLNAKFNQLINLRNGIRHSRQVDDVTRMEGEASILWFKKILSPN